MEESPKVLPGHSDEAHPEIFNIIPQRRRDGPLLPGQLTDEQLKLFFKNGFIVLDSFFTREELDQAREAVNCLVDELAQTLYKAGKIKSLYSEYGFNDRLVKIEEDFPGSNILLLKMGNLIKGLRDVWSNERALNVARQILDTDDISGSPVWNLRTKTPNNAATTVPWHQDVGYMDNRAYKTFQLGAWIPLVDADAVNGCLQFIRGGHKTGKVADHECCWNGTWYVMMVESEIKNKLECDPETDLITCPVPYGGVIFFNNMIPHRSLNNLSEHVRWSLDFRWQAANSPDLFFGLKPSIRMTSSTDPNFVIDWDSFNAINRHKKASELGGHETNEFDTTLQGPYMLKWDLVSENRHTDSMQQSAEQNWRNVPVIG